MSTIICDFDGVIHSYTSGWKGADVIPDPPVPGAIEWINEMANHFQIAIFSSRSGQDGGIDEMRKYMMKHGLDTEHLRENRVFFAKDKVPALMSIDDRGFRFNGTFPSKLEIDSFKPWNKKSV